MATENKRHRRWVFALLASACILAALMTVILCAFWSRRDKRVDFLSWLEGSHITWNDSLAIFKLRTLSSVQEQYKTRYERYGTLKELSTATFIDSSLAHATNPEDALDGYYYILTQGDKTWSVVAMPAIPEVTGDTSLYLDQTGILRAARCETADDPPPDKNSLPLDEYWKKSR
jgi:hypothetical protein